MDFSITYRLLSSVHFVAVDETFGILQGPKGSKCLQNTHYIQLLLRLQQTPCSCISLIEEFMGSFSPPDIHYALDLLVQEGYIGNSRDPDLTKDYSPRPNVAALPKLSWQHCSDTAIPKLSVHDSIWDPMLSVTYVQHQATDIPWLPLLIGTTQSFIGPVFTVQEGACIDCLQHRIQQNDSIGAWYLQRSGQHLKAPFLIANALLQATEQTLIHFSQQWQPHLNSQELWAVDATGKITKHKVQKRPECPSCGDATLMTQQMQSPITLLPALKNLDATSGYRSVKPLTTWRRLQKHLSPITGILSPLKNLSAPKTSLHVYQTNYTQKPMTDRPHIREFYETALGKGTTAIASKVSALCEGIERASVRYHGDEPLLKATLKHLKSQAIAPSQIQHFHTIQFVEPEMTHALGPVPKPMDLEEAIDWLPAWSLRDQERRYVPADAVLYGLPKSAQDRVAVFESNGLSAGNTIEEAITQGLFELIERDAVAIWWFNKLLRPSFDLKIMEGDVWFLQTLENFKSQGIGVHFLDLTLDTGVPVVAAIGIFEQGYLIGYGCHLDPTLALNRAFAELIQVMAVMAPVKPPPSYEEVDYLYPSPKALKVSPILCDFENVQGQEGILQKVIARLALLAIDTIVVNCTRPEIGFPVVKVLAPGLRAFRPRFGEGRLYQVPLQLGLQKQAKTHTMFQPMWLTIAPFAIPAPAMAFYSNVS